MQDMFNRIKITISLLGVCLITMLAACKKDWLEAKQNINVVVPTTLEDLKAILNNSYLVFGFDYSGLLDASADEYYLSETAFNSQSETMRRTYLWEKDIFSGAVAVDEWNKPYEQIFAANAVLEGLEKLTISDSQRTDWNDIKGAALFFRARAYYHLAQLFTPPYGSPDVDGNLGVPLREGTDIYAVVYRSSIEETYIQIVQDLTEATSLLKATSTNKTYPTKAAAHGLLARCYLLMAQYEAAKREADAALRLVPGLLDFNEVDGGPIYPFELFNKEVIFSSQLAPSYFPQILGRVDTVLLSMYDDKDIRKSLFFRDMGDGSFTFRGSYLGSAQAFGGIAADEMVLIRAECNVRLGQVEAALEDLNTLLINRIEQVGYTPLRFTESEMLLEKIFEERRKELLFRGLRWPDIRRYNQEGRSVMLERILSGNEYLLMPNDVKYVMPIPDYIIQTNGINQNVR